MITWLFSFNKIISHEPLTTYCYYPSPQTESNTAASASPLPTTKKNRGHEWKVRKCISFFILLWFLHFYWNTHALSKMFILCHLPDWVGDVTFSLALQALVESVWLRERWIWILHIFLPWHTHPSLMFLNCRVPPQADSDNPTPRMIWTYTLHHFCCFQPEHRKQGLGEKVRQCLLPFSHWFLEACC